MPSVGLVVRPLGDEGRLSVSRLSTILGCVHKLLNNESAPADELLDPVDVAMRHFRRTSFPNQPMFELMSSVYRLESMIALNMEEALKPHGINLTNFLALCTLSTVGSRGLRHKQ